jgi:hypothetical protein
MNLWVKRIALGLTAALALFLFACLDEDNLLGFPNQNQKFKLSYIEIPIESSVLLFDSLRTSNHNADQTKRLLVGSYTDPVFGSVVAEAYTQIKPGNTALAKPTTAVFDSVSLVLQFDQYHYGTSAPSYETFSVHELSERLTHRGGNDYYATTSVGYEAASLGEKSVFLSADRLDSIGANSDTTATISIPLSSSYGERLFAAWNSTDESFTDFQQFSSIFKGLAITGEMNQKIVGFSVGTNSKVVLHYHTDTDTTTYDFLLSTIVSSSNIAVDRTGSALSGLSTPYEEYIPSDANRRYVQSGVPIVTKLDLSAFTEYFKNFDKVLINSAELSISAVDAPGDFDPPNSLFIQILDNQNRLKKFRLTDQDTTDLRLYSNTSFAITNGLQGLPTSQINKDSIFTVMGDSQQEFAALKYDSDDKTYKGFITLFAQELAQDEVDTESNLTKTKFTDLILYPGDPHASKSINRVSFEKSTMKLKIYYSTPIENE